MKIKGVELPEVFKVENGYLIKYNKQSYIATNEAILQDMVAQMISVEVAPKLAIVLIESVTPKEIKGTE